MTIGIMCRMRYANTFHALMSKQNSTLVAAQWRCRDNLVATMASGRRAILLAAALTCVLLLLPIVVRAKGYQELLATVLNDYEARVRSSDDPAKKTVIFITVTLFNILSMVGCPVSNQMPQVTPVDDAE